MGKKTPSTFSDGVCWSYTWRSALFLRLLTTCEVVVVGHATVIVGIHVPGEGTLRKGALRSLDFLEQFVRLALFFHDLVPHLQLLLQDGVGGLVELDAVFLLKLDVVLGVTVDVLPGHVG